jgi:hypothetical protein
MKLAQLISNFSFIKILTAEKSTVHVVYLVKCGDLGSLYFSVSPEFFVQFIPWGDCMEFGE